MMNYCMECGTKLEMRFLENEGDVPYCPHCEAFRFPVFSSAVSMVVQNPTKDKILLIKQYDRDFYILVAGYINKGECAEHAVVREVKEETGLNVSSLLFNKSEYFEPSNTLMNNFSCIAESEDLSGVTKEVDVATWFTIAEAKENIKHGSLAEKFLLSYLDKTGK
jgi:NAD+ diphosphatase